MWKPPQNVMFPWLASISRNLQGVHLPQFSSKEIWIFTDYVFENRQFDYDVLSILLFDPDTSRGWSDSIQHLRTTSDFSNRRMSYKTLKDGVRQKAFHSFMSAANELDGLIFSLAVHKSLKHPIITPDMVGKYQSLLSLKANWTFKVLERMLIISKVTAFLISGLSHFGQNVMWISDQDDIFANSDFSNDTCTFFTKFLHIFSSHSYGTISIGTTQLTEPDLIEEDLAAISDICAGGTGELLTLIRKEYGCIPGIAFELKSKLPPKPTNFFNWYTSPSEKLRKHVCVLDRQGKELRTIYWRGK